MSALNRIVSGSSASMVGLLVNVVGQIALVPLFLTHWDQATFGIWAVVQGLLAIMQLIDYGHQDFVGFECLRKPIDDRMARSQILSAAIPFALLTGCSPMLIVAVMWAVGGFNLMFDTGDSQAARIAAEASAIYSIAWLFSQSPSGLLGRVAASVGEAPRQQWYNVFHSLTAMLAQAAAAIAGLGVVGVVACQAFVAVLWHTNASWRYLKILRARSVEILVPDLKLGRRNLFHSFALTFSGAIETLQLAGFRVVLVPLVGPLAIAQFSTLRTVANTAQQGINTFVYPTVPELMRVASERNKTGTVAVLGLLWLLAVMLIAPGIVILQLIAPFIYESWTRGKIPWDGMTFSLLSASILINGFGQPARAILRGNNLLRQQILVSGFAAIILLGATWLIVPTFGLLGAALALAAGEAMRCVLNIVWSNRWLRSAGLSTGGSTMTISGAVVVGGSLVLTSMAHWPKSAIAIAGAFMVCWAVSLFWFWRTLPPQVFDRLQPLLSRMRVRRRHLQ